MGEAEAVPRILLLDEAVVNRIAAGEIIQARDFACHAPELRAPPPMPPLPLPLPLPRRPSAA